MKPFNLELALAGKEVCTRDGRSVKIGGFNPDADNDVKLIGWIGSRHDRSKTLRSRFIGWYDNGKYVADQDHDYDLFMVSPPKVKRSGWINIYEQLLDSNERIAGLVFETREIAIEEADSSEQLVATNKIYWEEESN